jgi:hypothetical protein
MLWSVNDNGNKDKNSLEKPERIVFVFFLEEKFYDLYNFFDRAMEKILLVSRAPNAILIDGITKLFTADITCQLKFVP